MPIILKSCIRRNANFPIYGFDYNTKDGTGIRDYIHVIDIAEGHLSALGFIKKNYGNHF